MVVTDTDREGCSTKLESTQTLQQLSGHCSKGRGGDASQEANPLPVPLLYGVSIFHIPRGA